MRQTRRPWTLATRALALAGALCLAWALAKGVVHAFGARAPGQVITQERGLSTRGATWVRYAFDDAQGERHTGTAMTAVAQAVNARVRIAYLSAAPDLLNQPADAGYTAVMVAGWSTLGLALLGAGLALRPRAAPA